MMLQMWHTGWAMWRTIAWAFQYCNEVAGGFGAEMEWGGTPDNCSTAAWSRGHGARAAVCAT